MTKMAVRCGSQDHRQRIGSVEVLEDEVVFTRLFPAAGILHESGVEDDDDDDDPYLPRRNTADARLSRQAAAAFAMEWAAEDRERRLSIAKPVGFWFWPEPGFAAEMMHDPSQTHLWMASDTFWKAGPKDGLFYWCPRHHDLILLGVDIHTAMEDREDVLARDIRDLSQ